MFLVILKFILQIILYLFIHRMLTITEDVDYQKRVMHQVKSRVKELDRMMSYSHVYLENIKHLTEKIHGMF